MILLILACGTPEKEAETNLGTITADRAGEAADVLAAAGFGYSGQGKAILVFTGNPDATCAGVASLLTSKDPVDPTDILQQHSCEFTTLMTYDGTKVTVEDDKLAATVALSCAMDEGEWNLETRDQGDKDYFYSGPYWQGHPESFSLSLSGGEGEDFAMDLEMSDYSGNFIYESLDAAPASGAVAGSVQFTWCPDLSQAAIYKSSI